MRYVPLRSIAARPCEGIVVAMVVSAVPRIRWYAALRQMLGRLQRAVGKSFIARITADPPLVADAMRLAAVWSAVARVKAGQPRRAAFQRSFRKLSEAPRIVVRVRHSGS